MVRRGGFDLRFGGGVMSGVSVRLPAVCMSLAEVSVPTPVCSHAVLLLRVLRASSLGDAWFAGVSPSTACLLIQRFPRWVPFLQS